jgi:hypothetical protein
MRGASVNGLPGDWNIPISEQRLNGLVGAFLRRMELDHGPNRGGNGRNGSLRLRSEHVMFQRQNAGGEAGGIVE